VALLCGAGGLLLAHWIVPLLAALNPVQGFRSPASFTIQNRRRVLIFPLCVTLGTGVIFGLVPALKCAGEREVMPSLKQGDQKKRERAGHRLLMS